MAIVINTEPICFACGSSQIDYGFPGSSLPESALRSLRETRARFNPVRSHEHANAAEQGYKRLNTQRVFVEMTA